MNNELSHCQSSELPVKCHSEYRSFQNISCSLTCQLGLCSQYFLKLTSHLQISYSSPYLGRQGQQKVTDDCPSQTEHSTCSAPVTTAPILVIKACSKCKKSYPMLLTGYCDHPHEAGLSSATRIPILLICSVLLVGLGLA